MVFYLSAADKARSEGNGIRTSKSLGKISVDIEKSGASEGSFMGSFERREPEDKLNLGARTTISKTDYSFSTRNE